MNTATQNQTEVKDNGHFVLRSRTFIYKGFLCECVIQSSEFYKSSVSYYLYPEGMDNVGYGNFSKDQLNAKIEFCLKFPKFFSK
jgi:hypothetical protein